MKALSSKQTQIVPTYKARTELLAPQEVALYETLCEIFGTRNEVLLKVSLAEVVAIPGSDRRYLSHWRRVQRRTLDFLICSPPTMIPILGVKVESEGETRKRRKGGRDVMDKVLEDIGLPLLRLKAREKYKVKDLAKQISILLEETMEIRPDSDAESEGGIWSKAKQKFGLSG